MTSSIRIQASCASNTKVVVVVSENNTAAKHELRDGEQKEFYAGERRTITIAEIVEGSREDAEMEAFFAMMQDRPEAQMREREPMAGNVIEIDAATGEIVQLPTSEPEPAPQVMTAPDGMPAAEEAHALDPDAGIGSVVEPRDPLDHDGDGRKGGSLPKAKRSGK